MGLSARAAWFGCCFLAISWSTARAELPSVDFLFPSGGKQGSAFDVTAGGKLDPWPPSVWTDSPELRFTALTNKGTFRVEIGTNAPLGAHLIRFYNPEGASAPRQFIVSRWNEITEAKAPSAKPQALTNLPVVVNGRLERNNDSDAYKVRVEKGKWLVAQLDGYRLDSPIDPVLQVTDQNGTQLALNHDHRKLDPLLAFQSPESADYILQVFAFAYPPKAQVSFTGSDASIYRLAITTGPFAEFTFPSGVERKPGFVHVTGWNLGANGRSVVREVNGSTIAPLENEIALDGFGPVPRILPVGTDAETREIEPNNTVDVAQPVRFPCVVNGQIDPSGDSDRFRFAAKGKQAVQLRIRSALFGFPLDPVLTIEDASGKQLAKSDDAGGSRDAQVDWTPPVDGDYVVTVSDLVQSGGPSFVYRLEIRVPVPHFEATIEEHALRIEPEKTAPLKISVKRLGQFTESIVVLAHGLPEGISATTAEVPPKGGDVMLTFSATAEAKTANVPIQIHAIVPDPARPRVQRVPVRWKPTHAKPGDLHVSDAHGVWLTVLPKPPPPAESPKPSE